MANTKTNISSGYGTSVKGVNLPSPIYVCGGTSAVMGADQLDWGSLKINNVAINSTDNLLATLLGLIDNAASTGGDVEIVAKDLWGTY